VPGSAVAFTVTPAAGSRLSTGGFDSVARGKNDMDAVAKILVVFGTRWANDNHDVRVTYQGRKLKAAELAQMPVDPGPGRRCSNLGGATAALPPRSLIPPEPDFKPRRGRATATFG
jgi:hypothetical protein